MVVSAPVCPDLQMRGEEKMRYDVILGYDIEETEEGWEKMRGG